MRPTFLAFALYCCCAVSQEISAASAPDGSELIYRNDSGVTVSVAELSYYFSDWGQGRSAEAAKKIPNLEIAVEAIYLTKTIAAEFERDATRDDELVTMYAEDQIRRQKMSIWLDETARSMLAEMDWATLAREEYLANPDLYEKPEKLRASHILIKTEDKRLFDAISVAEKARLETLTDENFDDLATAYSESQSGVRGGDIGFFSRGDMVPAFENAAFDLEVGEISDLVITQFGVHIIKLTGREPPARAPFEEVEAYIVDALKKKHSGEIRDRLVNNIREGMLSSDAFYNESLVESLRADPQALVRQ